VASQRSRKRIGGVPRDLSVGCLTRASLLRDRERDEWFADAPVLLEFDSEQVEVQHNKSKRSAPFAGWSSHAG
jgi:hypothetical protein